VHIIPDREHALLNRFQRDFPLCEAPYAEIATQLATTQDWVLAKLRRFIGDGTVSRVGAIFRPGSVGVSTLAAMAVPRARLADVARRINARPGVNHNYEREHRFNLWFVAHAPDRVRLASLVAGIERETALPVVSLPLVREYCIDLGFALDGARHGGVAPRAHGGMPVPAELDADDARIAAALQEGLPFEPRPFAAIAAKAQLPPAEGEALVIHRLHDWLRDGTVKRVGVIVRHRELGYVANVMAVWDVPDAEVDAHGVALSREPGVTLSYRRERALPAWPYNLFCMIHGRERGDVESSLDAIARRQGLVRFPHARLFSRTAFKQRGALSFAPAPLHG
jgi:DNA-binding Lrp family transcriptional regulator